MPEYLSPDRAGNLGIRRYTGVARTLNCAVVDSEVVPAKRHWLLQSCLFQAAGPGTAGLDFTASGIYICQAGTPVPADDFAAAVTDYTNRGLPISFLQNFNQTPDDNGNVIFQKNDSGLYTVPSGFIVRAVAAVTLPNTPAQITFAMLALGIIQEDNC